MKAMRYHYMALLWFIILGVINVCVIIITQKDGKIYPPLPTSLLGIGTGGMAVIYIRGFWKITDWGKDKAKLQVIYFLLMLSSSIFTIFCGYDVIQYLIEHA